MKHTWILMTLQKYNFYHELTPMSRVYTQFEMVIFSCSITLGYTFFYRIPLYVLNHGGILLLFWLIYTPLLLLTASCFAEMAALMPAVGAHYHYCYSTIGEFVAFLVGWHLLFGYTIITMTKCKYLGDFIDQMLLNGWASKNLRFMDENGYMFFCIPGYVDVISPILAVTMAIQATCAVRFSKTVVNLLISICIIVIVILLIAFTAKMEFTAVRTGNTPTKEKLYSALELVQKALVGYETLSVLGEEAKGPTRAIPLSIMISVRIVIIIYIALTFVISIYLKNESLVDIDLQNPLGSIVIKLGMPWLYWIAIIGSIFGFWCSAYGSMFIAIRILFGMSRDGMIFKKFSKIDKYTLKPAVPALMFGIIIGLTTTFIFVFSNIGYASLVIAKIMTTSCLLITRYRLEKEPLAPKDKKNPTEKEINNWVLINYPESKTRPTKITHTISLMLIYNSVMSALAAVYCFVILQSSTLGNMKDFFKITGFGSIILFLFFSFLLRLQPTNDRTNLSFTAPYIPMFPMIAIIGDFFSALVLCQQVWICILLWTVLGVVFYFVYSIWHSQEGRNLHADGTRWSSLDSTPDLKVASASSHSDL